VAGSACTGGAVYVVGVVGGWALLALALAHSGLLLQHLLRIQAGFLRLEKVQPHPEEMLLVLALVGLGWFAAAAAAAAARVRLLLLCCRSLHNVGGGLRPFGFPRTGPFDCG
jgi:hypothetical protein